MIKNEPQLFKEWGLYMRQRQIMASAIMFKNHGWNQWNVGHAKLFGILLWHYEAKRRKTFKYSKVLKKQGYRRTHNYRLLKNMVENHLLVREKKGYYCFPEEYQKLIDKMLVKLKELDRIGFEEKEESK